VFVWADLIPEPYELAQRTRAIGAEFSSAVAPLAPAAALR